MEQGRSSKVPTGDLRISIEENNKGVKDIDFFADYTKRKAIMKYSQKTESSEMGPLYLRTALTSLSCPHCGGEVKRSHRFRPVEWLLKFAGRKAFYCSDCNWHENIKIGKWQWETIATALVAFLIVCAASIHWMLR